MFHLRRRVGAAMVAGMIGLGAVTVLADQPATQPSNQDLQAQIQQLKAQVNELKSNQQENQVDEELAVQQVITEANQNSQLFDASTGDATSGYLAKRFFIASEDGDYTFKPWIHIQVRDVTNMADGNYPVQNGIEIRRARFGFDGNLFGKDFTYFINWATNRANSTLTVKNTAGATVGTTTSPVGGLPVLEEAWMKYHIPDTVFYLHAGQMHDPLDHENIVGSKYRAPEASLQGDIFGNTDTFTKAITAIYDPKTDLRAEAGVNDGIRSANTNFEDAPNNGNAYDGGVAGRVEYKMMGNWKDYDQLTAYGDKDDLLVLGSGIDWSYGERRVRDDLATPPICNMAIRKVGLRISAISGGIRIIRSEFPPPATRRIRSERRAILARIPMSHRWTTGRLHDHRQARAVRPLRIHAPPRHPGREQQQRDGHLAGRQLLFLWTQSEVHGNGDLSADGNSHQRYEFGCLGRQQQG